ncbi:UNKNOWN [Stylonychia lemnae]|uniref:Uncharacterized protein n=1 Tax=Stylonychia lemnae TaxID=5949 RepID=A0A078AWZ6_STYLE|nr:UNKNOWN [Stylonychia lemnae]|eukprot:CDW85777.1 UNKNOWN [Stylonychia lemnae]
MNRKQKSIQKKSLENSQGLQQKQPESQVQEYENKEPQQSQIGEPYNEKRVKFHHKKYIRNESLSQAQILKKRSKCDQQTNWKEEDQNDFSGKHSKNSNTIQQIPQDLDLNIEIMNEDTQLPQNTEESSETDDAVNNSVPTIARNKSQECKQKKLEKCIRHSLEDEDIHQRNLKIKLNNEKDLEYEEYFISEEQFNQSLLQTQDHNNEGSREILNRKDQSTGIVELLNSNSQFDERTTKENTNHL